MVLVVIDCMANCEVFLGPTRSNNVCMFAEKVVRTDTKAKPASKGVKGKSAGRMVRLG